MSLDIQILAWNRNKNVTGLNWLIVSQPSPINSCINIFTNIEMITFLE
jgi:subtilase family serine protease